MVIIGYGRYRGYKIQQGPNEFLSELAMRYPLNHDHQTGAEYADLQLTIAIHEEAQRRQNGGAVFAKEPSAKELAIKLVNKGYQLLSKDHHPDRKGGTEAAQKTLNTVRAQLLNACEEMRDEWPEDALTISEPATTHIGPITDEDCPF